MNLTRDKWLDGWRPSDHEVGGSPTGLLRADNVSYEEDGALTLMRGAVKLNPTAFGFDVQALYSKYIGDVKYRFIGRSNGDMLYSVDGASWNELFSGGSATDVAFTHGLGFIYIFSGNKRMKYRGGDPTTLSNITPDFPATAPQVMEAEKNDFVFLTEAGMADYSQFVRIEGEAATFENGTYLQITTEENKARTDLTFPVALDTMTLGAGGTGGPDDLFMLVVRVSDKSHLKSIRVTFSLADDGSFDPPYDNYWYEWTNSGEPPTFPAGTDSWVVLQCKRSDFTKESTVTSQDWSSVNAMSIRVDSDGPFTLRVDENGILFAGSNTNPLSGLYEYMQVNVNDTGAGIFKSKPSPASKYVTLLGGAAQVTTVGVSDPQVNEIWLYRRDVTWLSDVREIGEPRKLDQWYRIKVIEGSLATLGSPQTFIDTVSDMDALIENQTYPIDPWSVSEFTPDVIVDCTEPFNGRLVMMGKKDIYFSYEEDLGLYSPLWTVRLSGDTTEQNLWVKKIGVNQILIGTTSDIYELSGTCAELPDGSIDIRITPIGVEYPPIHKASCLDAGTVYFVAADGLRTIGASGQTLVSPQLNSLFQDRVCHGIPPVEKAKLESGYKQYSLEVCQGKIWFVVTLEEVGRKTFVYDILRQRWSFWDQGPIALFAEEDDTLLGGYGFPDEEFIRILNTGSTIDDHGQDVNILTIFDDNGQPRNRKDIFTLKVTADTGNLPVTISLAKDSGAFVNLGEYQFNGISEHLIEVATTVGLGFRYALRITGTNLTTFDLINYTIEYDPRPEQLNYLRIPYNNLGTVSRKRFITYAIVCDTLGNTITLTPLIDGIAYATSEITLDRKGTHIHYFLSETTGTDVGAILNGGIFEYYSLNAEEIVSEKLPVPTKYLVIPANDYGNPNRKRHSSYKFQAHTRGAATRFTPKIDGTFYAPMDFSTTEKRTVEYFFTVDTIGIDIGGILETISDTPFEFYGTIVPQELELFPPRLKEFRIPETNYGVPAKKRIRTMPMMINTNGHDVTFTPIIDGVPGTPSIFNTSHRQTVLHYFTDDVFGIDFSGELTSDFPFEFYGLEKPVDVEVLPTGKKFDQVGPLDLDRLGKLNGFRIKAMTTGTELPFKIFMEDTEVWNGVIPTVPNKLKIYEVMRVPKTLMGTSMRIEFGPAEVLHRYWVKARINISGNDTQIQEFSLQ